MITQIYLVLGCKHISQVAELAYKPLALPIIGEMGMYNTITGSNPVLDYKLTKTNKIMAKKKFDVFIIFNCEEILALIPGRGAGLFQQVKKHIYWDTILEEIGQSDLEIKSAEQLEQIFKNDNDNNYSIRVEIVKDVQYH